MKTLNSPTLIINRHKLALLVLLLTPVATATAGGGVAEGTLGSATGSPGQQASYNAMTSICAATKTNASFACSLVGQGAFFNAGAAINNSLQLQQLSPQAAMQVETIAISSPYQFIRKLQQQAQQLRDHRQDTSSQSTPNGNGASADADSYSFLGPFGISFSAGGGFGDKETASGQTGFNIDTRQANLTIDYQIAPALVGGFSFGYLNTERKFGFDSGNLSADSYRFAPFVSYTPSENSYVTLLGGYARVNFDSRRHFTPSTNTTNDGDKFTFTISDATATYNANEFFASLGAGYTFKKAAWSLRGYGRGDFSQMNIGGIQESGGLFNDTDGYSFTNQANRQSILSVTSTLGAELSYAFSTTTLAAVIIPKIHAEWVHEYENGARQLNTNYIAASSNTKPWVASPQSITIAGPVRDWANLGVGVQMQFPHAIVGYLNYDTLFIQDASNQSVSGGVRINF